MLEDINLQIEKGQRICLLGRNGTGKSTLMKIIHGSLSPDSGTVFREQSIRTSYFTQEIPQNINGTVFEIIALGLGTRGKLLINYHHEEQRLLSSNDPDHSLLNELHSEMERHHSWSALEEIQKTTTLMQLEEDWDYNTLSGGQKRRALLAAALVSQPDLLLLDEPTNHLDIITIKWLEEYLVRQNITLLFVTHDRMLLKNLATRIIELDRGNLVDWSCDYETFLKRKQAVLDNEEKEWEKFDKKLSQEEIWIRKGIKARRTRNEGRVRELIKMRNERKQRRERLGTASIKMSTAQQSGKLVIEAQHLSFGYENQAILSDFSTTIMRGDKVGIIGPNGCGKTTLVRLLLGELEPHKGSVKHGTKLEIAYFDQMREQLDENKSIWENVHPHGDFITINGKQKHVVAYLQDFLFTPERTKTPVISLSGGERNRLCLARLFTQPANLLILDEPTNDLDAETLELLEELLNDFPGTLLLISHDRALLNNVVTSSIVFSKKQDPKEIIGGYDDWLVIEQQQTEKETVPKTDKKKIYKEKKKAGQKVKRTYKEDKELEKLPALIEELEKEQQTLYAQMSDPEFYKDKHKVVDAKNRIAELEKELSDSYNRWEYLESIGS